MNEENRILDEELEKVNGGAVVFDSGLTPNGCGCNSESTPNCAAAFVKGDPRGAGNNGGAIYNTNP